MSTYFDVSNLFTMDSIFTTEPLFDFYIDYLRDYLRGTHHRGNFKGF